MEQQRLEEMRDNSNYARSNKTSMPYNPINLRYDDGMDGDDVEGAGAGAGLPAAVRNDPAGVLSKLVAEAMALQMVSDMQKIPAGSEKSEHRAEENWERLIEGMDQNIRGPKEQRGDN